MQQVGCHQSTSPTPRSRVLFQFTQTETLYLQNFTLPSSWKFAQFAQDSHNLLGPFYSEHLMDRPRRLAVAISGRPRHRNIRFACEP